MKVPKGKHKANKPPKKRYMFGLREVQKHLSAGNLTMVILATNLEKVEDERGIDEVVNEIAQSCRRVGVPLIFSMNRYQLGCVAQFKGMKVSAVGI